MPPWFDLRLRRLTSPQTAHLQRSRNGERRTGRVLAAFRHSRNANEPLETGPSFVVLSSTRTTITMSGGTDQWPPALKVSPLCLSTRSHRLSSPLSQAFVNATFAACTEGNRAKVETELKQAIYQAYTAGTLDKVDWTNYKLESCVHLLRCLQEP